MDNTSNIDFNQAFAAFSAFMGVWALIMLGIWILTIWFFWRIFAKAGMSGALSLLNIIPFGTFICLIILAFGTWPALGGTQSNYSAQPGTS